MARRVLRRRPASEYEPHVPVMRAYRSREPPHASAAVALATEFLRDIPDDEPVCKPRTRRRRSNVSVRWVARKVRGSERLRLNEVLSFSNGKGLSANAKLFMSLVGRTGFEPVTNGLKLRIRV